MTGVGQLAPALTGQNAPQKGSCLVSGNPRIFPATQFRLVDFNKLRIWFNEKILVGLGYIRDYTYYPAKNRDYLISHEIRIPSLTNQIQDIHGIILPSYIGLQ